MRPPGAILADIGGVLVRDQWSEFAARLVPRGSTQFESLRGKLRRRARKLDLGIETVAEFCLEIRKKAGLRQSSDELVRLALDGSLVLIPDNVRTLTEFGAKHRIRLLAVTNVGEEISASLEKKFRLSRVFDDFARSYELGVRKPDPRIFESAVNRAGVDPGLCLYLDDSLRYIRAARRLGIPSEWIRRPESLKRRLERYAG
ncbi:MAG TPA: HAD-IA family hydrolase [Thermoplasmata archaeon]|nr:HAD-IA family hydrolase [Thermoplasmata archaeon]